jgi:diguanylate cyclase (GGDEF)-like protein
MTTYADRWNALWRAAATVSQENHLVQGEATMATLRRFVWLLYFLVPIHLLLALWYGVFYAPGDRPEMQQWAQGKCAVQFTMGCVSIVLGVVVRAFVRRQARASYGAIALHGLLCAAYGTFGMADSIVDQRAGLGITSYFMISVAVAALSLMRPLFAVLCFSIGTLEFAVLLLWVGLDAAEMTRAIVQTLVATAVSLVVAVAVWRQYAHLVLLRRELLVKQDELAHLAERDSLTGLYNRRTFTRLAGAELERAQRFPHGVGLLMVDLDHFKSINDKHGHPAGDEVLKQVGGMILASVRTSDVAARMGGEEFIVLLPNADHKGALIAANKLCDAIRQQPLALPGLALPVTASVGVTAMQAGQRITLDVLYAAADQALYAAKKGGRNRVEFAPPSSLPLDPVLS